jgi:nitrogen-specific signal transduction histidine kinase/ActR/RegA family two-component response regulator
MFVEIRAIPRFDSNNQLIGLIHIVRDITERKRMEEEILKARKLESVGILAGGLAHDFNNLLQGILGNISFAKTLSNPEDRVYKILENAESSYMRAISLTNQLITFSKQGEPIKKPAFVKNLIKDTTSFTLSGSGIRSKFNIPDNLWPVDVDEGQITRVIQNIVMNARDAMPEAGTVNVAAENTTVSEKDSIALNNGKYIKISIEDHGAGIPEENLSKIFDPYFSTKDRVSEKGMGLGLTICYSIIKNHEGLITVESKSDIGTTFQIYLPASEKEEVRKEKTKAESFTVKGRVLIMDDEAVVTDFVEEFLRHIGCEVEVARDGEEAIDLYKKDLEAQRPFDVVILDLTVPGGMGGRETIGKLLEINPDVKAVASSGYSNDPVMTDFEQYGFKGILIKPYQIENLNEILSKLV